MIIKKLTLISIIFISTYLNNAYSQSVDYSKIDTNSYQPNYSYNPNQDFNNSITNIKQEFNNSITNILPNFKESPKDFWDNPRTIHLKRQETGEEVNVVYYSNGSINQHGYYLASYILRDQRQNKMMYVDIKLLDLICAVQAWIKHYGYKGPIIVHSGFRTVSTNNKLEGSAKKSMHLVGRAVDFSIPGVKSSILADIAKKFNAGGIGVYYHRNFLHMDTGHVRTWDRD